jgi:hypothetical protein
MFDQIALGREFFERLRAVDEAIVEKVAAGRCRFCRGPMHRSDYPRKPRGGFVGEAIEGHHRRLSLCCGREGCRRRETPPSVRFLGRRVYAAAVVIVASVVALAVTAAAAFRRRTGIAPRTGRRWLRWWRGPFLESRVFLEMSALLVPPVARASLPTLLLERLRGEPVERLIRLLRWLLPISTTSSDASRFVRDLV